MSGPRKRERAPVKVTSAGPEPVLYAALPASVPQALRIARQYANHAASGETLLVSRGHKIFHRLEQKLEEGLEQVLEQGLDQGAAREEMAERTA